MNKNNQLAVINGEALTERDVFSAVDTVLSDLYANNNTDRLFSAINAMESIAKVTGLAKAKLLWGAQEWWKSTNQTEARNDEFVDAVEAETGTTPTTTKRYTLVWQCVEDCTIPKEIQSRKMDDLVKIATTLSQGFEIDKDAWNKIKKAANSAEVRDVLREIKGQEPRKTNKKVVYGRDGVLSLVMPNGEKIYIGFLAYDTTNETVQQLHRRILDALQAKEL